MKVFKVVLLILVFYGLLYLLTCAFAMLWGKSFVETFLDTYLFSMYSIFYFFGVFVWWASYFFHRNH